MAGKEQDSINLTSGYEDDGVQESASEEDEGFLRLLKTRKYSDLTLSCLGRTFKVHKAIVASQSAYVQSKCDELEKSAETTDSIRVDLILDDLFQITEITRIEDMITFLYTAKYPPPHLAHITRAHAGPEDHAIEHAFMFELACKLDIAKLRNAAAKALKGLLESVDTATCDLEFLTDLVVIVYEPKLDANTLVLRKILEDFVKKNKENIATMSSLKQVAVEMPEFGRDLSAILREA